MRGFPVAERELRVAARQRRVFWTRWAAALLAAAFAGYAFWAVSNMAVGGSTGRQVFAALVQVTFIYCLFAGAGRTADCLSREKREGTLGLLFLTDLRSSDIVLGKLAAASVHVLYGVAAAFPVFAICVIVGGVQPGEFWRIMLAVLNTLFLSLSIGLFVSAAGREERRVVQTSSAIMLVFGMALPAVGEYLRTKTSAVELGLFIKAFSPALTLDLSTTPTAAVRTFWWSVVAVHFVAWAALAGAWTVLPRSWQDKPASRPAPFRERWERWLVRHDTRGRTSGRHFLDKNPFCWLAMRSKLVVYETWMLLGVFVLLAAWAAWFFYGTFPVFAVCVMLAIALHAAGKMQVCAAACDRLAEDKQSGALETLLATPLRVSEILRGQMLALARQFGSVISAVIVFEFFLLLGVLALNEQDFLAEREQVRNCVLLFAAAVLMLVVDAIAIGWVGMWQALSARNIQQARSRTLFFILFLPWLVLILGMSYTVARRPHSREGFLLNGRRFRMTRGIAEVDIQTSPKYVFTLFVAHLKSRRPSAAADQADLREQEALVLRELVNARLQSHPNANIAIAGDLNDIQSAPSTRAVIGRGKLALVDTRPPERHVASNIPSDPAEAARKIVWTHFYAIEDSYSRVDYLLVSRGMAREWLPNESYVLALPNWGAASDHRPVLGRFTAADK